MNKILNLLSIMIVASSLILTGCAKDDSSSSSSSSSSSDADATVAAASGSGALTISSKVSMVTANSEASASSRTSLKSASDFTSGEDITVDQTETFVYERSADAFRTANSILCWMGQTRAGLMLGQGNYKAQIDKTQCNESSGGGSGGSNAPQYEMWTVNSSRADGEPMIVKAWVPMDWDEDGVEDSIIYAMTKVYQSPSDDYPWGHFKMSFRLVQGFTTSGTELFKGYLRTKKKKGGASVLQFYNPEPDGSGGTLQYSVTVRKESDGSGKAITTMPQWGQSGPTGKQKSYKIAFTDKYFYKQKKVDDTKSDPICLRRDQYMTNAWRYGLYHDNGSRLNINSGFPIKATASGTDYYGYIGYYGLWMPPQANVDNGSTVAKMDFGGSANQSGTNYTVRSWPGKLTKWTKKTITLAEIKNIPIFWRDRSDSYKNKRIYWNGTNFIINGVENSSTYMMEDVSESTLALNSTTAPYGVHFYSQALGGDGSIQLTYGSPPSNHLNPSDPSNSTSVIFNTREAVFPGDSVPSKLACYERCPDPATIASGTESTAFRNFQGTDNASATNAYMYSFDNSTNGMVLKQDNDSASVVLASANSNLRWGANSGILFDNTTANYNALRCSWDNNSICPWDARQDLSTFYTWETGTNDWQKLTVLVASDNSSVKFEPPMNVKYTLSGSSSNSGKSYDNASFYLEYGGFGNLWGLPSFCVNRKDGQKVSCANDDSTRYIEEIIVPAYAEVTQTADGTTKYLVKPLEIEQTMKKASSASDCGLSFGDISLPDDSGYTAPEMDARPVVEGPPAIVAGSKM